MTERERWVVYPLLFLALGASLRDKLFDRTTSKSIVCEELMVVDADTGGTEPIRVLAKIGRAELTPNAPPTGRLVVNGDVVIVDADDLAADGQPRPLVRMGRAPDGSGVPASGFLQVDGDANVAGQLVVQGVRIVPSLQILLHDLQLLLGGPRRTIPQEQTPPDVPATEPDRDK
jgi:hypothetical protein